MLKKFLSCCLMYFIIVGTISLDADAKHGKHKHVYKHPIYKSGPPHWAPAYGYRSQFIYYPHYHVYYYPRARQYFWIDAGVVKIGTRLPNWISLGHSGVSVELQRETPVFADFY